MAIRKNHLRGSDSCGGTPVPDARAGLEDDRLRVLVHRTLEGNEDAWRELWLSAEPILWSLTSRWRVTSQLSRNEDERRNIVVRVMELLRADGFRRLKRFYASSGHEQRGSFRAWLATMAARSAVSYLRAHPEYLGRSCAEGRSRWARLSPMQELDEPRVDPIEAIEGRVLLEQSRRQLKLEQLRALLLWLEGWTHTEIATQLCLTDDSTAERLVRSALWRLRDRFGAKKITPPPDGSAGTGVISSMKQ